MGLKYSSSESAMLMSAMRNNIHVSQEAMDSLNQGASRLTQALQSGRLSGQAYTAAKQLFQDAFIPTFRQVTSVLDHASSELNAYRQADSLVSHYGALDEDNIHAQIMQKQLQKNMTAGLLSGYQISISSNPTSPSCGVLRNSCSQLEIVSSTLDEDIQKLEEQLRVLQAFSDTTAHLFANTISDLQNAMDVVILLSQVTVNKQGDIVEKVIKATAKAGEFSGGAALLRKGEIKFVNGRAFLNGTKITMEKGVLLWGEKVLFDTTEGRSPLTRNLFKPQDKQLYKNGSAFEQASAQGLDDGIKLSHYRHPFKAAGSGFKDSIEVWDDFKGLKQASKVGKVVKGLGAAGTILTLGSDVAEDVHQYGWSEKAAGNFAIDAGVDLGTGAGATALGAAFGSAFLPPLGTVVGAGLGAGINGLINVKVPWLGNKSAVDAMKDGLKSLFGSE
jgi:hypothetical protein